MNNINIINQTIEEWFAKNRDINKVPVKDLMPEFIKNGVFKKDQKKGLPIRNILRELDRNDQLDSIPSIHPERKKVNTNWYFVRR